MKDFLQRILLAVTYRLSKIIGNIHVPFTHKLIKAKEYRAVSAILHPGMILLTRMHGELSNAFIPGEYTHSAIYAGQDGETHYVVEATRAGVIKSDLIDFMLSKDEVAIVSPVFATEPAMGAAVLFAEEQVGKPYNYEFKSNMQAFYCSELIFWSYKQALGDALPFTMRERLGVLTVTPDDFWQAQSKFKRLWSST